MRYLYLIYDRKGRKVSTDDFVIEKKMKKRTEFEPTRPITFLSDILKSPIYVASHSRNNSGLFKSPCVYKKQP